MELRCTAPAIAEVPKEVLAYVTEFMDQQANRTRERRHWAKWFVIASRFASIQVFTQGLGFVVGIFIIRKLTKPEYAVYTLANTMLASILILADSGISSAMTSIGGRVWQDAKALGQLVASAMQWRRYLAITTLFLVTPVMVWLLARNGATPVQLFIITILVLIGCAFEFLTRIYAVVLRLRSERGKLQVNAAIGVLVRGVLLLALWMRLNAVAALLGAVAGCGLQFILVWRWTRDVRDTSAHADPVMVSEIGGIIKKQAPNILFYCIQAQVTVWIISVFGHSSGVAEVGALGRLVAILAVVNTTLNEVIFPAFARIQNPGLVRTRYTELLALYAVGSAAFVILFAQFPRAFLWLLGPKYMSLEREGMLMAINVTMTAFAGLVWGLNTTRAWILYPWPQIVLVFGAQLVMVRTMNLSTVHGALIFSIISTFIGILWGCIVSCDGMLKEARKHKAMAVAA